MSAEKVREGDLISYINGQEASLLTNLEAQTLLNSENNKLRLRLSNKRVKNKNILTPVLTSPILAVSVDQARLPLPSSPEYILLKKSREKKISGSLTSLHDTSVVVIR